MKKYEITLIGRQDSANKQAQKQIESAGGKILSSSSLGQRQLAYPIKKEKTGFYFSFNFEIDPEKLPSLNQKLSLEDEILRYLIIIAPKEMPKPKEEKREKKIEEKPIKEMPKVEEETKEVPEPEKKTKEMPKKEEKVEKPAPKKVLPKEVKKESIPKPAEDEQERLDALDKKLDELLKE